MRRILEVAFLTGALTACQNSSSDSAYDNCIQEAAQSPTATGVQAASANCHYRFTQNSEARQAANSDKEAGTVVNAYWDGWNFQPGDLPAALKDKGYRIFSVGRYGVVICDVALPEAMGEALFNDDGSFKNSEGLNKDLVEICRPR